MYETNGQLQLKNTVRRAKLTDTPDITFIMLSYIIITTAIVKSFAITLFNINQFLI